jgi:carboxymethylenebutenolidase
MAERVSSKLGRQTPMSQTAISTENITLTVADGTSVNAYVARPTEPGSYPGLIVCQEAFGVNAHIRDLVERFAREGYVAIAPELFQRTAEGFDGDYGDFPSVMPHYGAVTDEGLTFDLQAAHGWLVETLGEDAPTAAIGYCLGGKTAFLASMVIPIRAAVSYYGGGIAPSPFGSGLLGRVSEVKAPVLLHWGGKDAHLGPETVAAVSSALTEAGKPFVSVAYSEADHAFFRDVWPSYHAESAAESLAITRAFLATHLG